MNRGLGIILLCAIAFSALMIFHIAKNKSFVDSFENKKTGANIKIVIIVVLPLVFMGIVAYVSETTKFGFVSTFLLIFALPIVGWIGLAYQACKIQSSSALDEQNETIKRVVKTSDIEPFHENGNQPPQKFQQMHERSNKNEEYPAYYLLLLFPLCIMGLYLLGGEETRSEIQAMFSAISNSLLPKK